MLLDGRGPHILRSFHEYRASENPSVKQNTPFAYTFLCNFITHVRLRGKFMHPYTSKLQEFLFGKSFFFQKK
jgi:hypothetical protein